MLPWVIEISGAKQQGEGHLHISAKQHMLKSDKRALNQPNHVHMNMSEENSKHA